MFHANSHTECLPARVALLQGPEQSRALALLEIHSCVRDEMLHRSRHSQQSRHRCAHREIWHAHILPVETSMTLQLLQTHHGQQKMVVSLVPVRGSTTGSTPAEGNSP